MPKNPSFRPQQRTEGAARRQRSVNFDLLPAKRKASLFLYSPLASERARQQKGNFLLPEHRTAEKLLYQTAFPERGTRDALREGTQGKYPPAQIFGDRSLWRCPFASQDATSLDLEETPRQSPSGAGYRLVLDTARCPPQGARCPRSAGRCFKPRCSEK